MSGFERQGTLDKLLVAVLEERAAAREAVRILWRLDGSGCIDLFATRVIEVDALGRAAVLDETQGGRSGPRCGCSPIASSSRSPVLPTSGYARSATSSSSDFGTAGRAQILGPRP